MHFMRNLAAVAAVTRAWFDWTPPVVMSVSAPEAFACAATSRIFLTLLPPKANPIVSSRLTSRRALHSSAARRLSSDSTGEGGTARAADGSAARDASMPFSIIVGPPDADRGSPWHAFCRAVRSQNDPDVSESERPTRVSHVNGAGILGPRK